MRSRAALVPLAAALATVMLFASTAVAQDPTPWPTPSETPTAMPDETDTAEPSPEPSPEPEPSKSPAPKAKESEDDTSAIAAEESDEGEPRPEERPNGTTTTAAQPKNLTLFATPHVVPVGRRVRIWGKAYPDGADRWIKIINAVTGRRLKTFRTDNDGRYEGYLQVRRNVAIRARYKTLKSDWRRLSAQPNVVARITDAKLFAASRVYGRVSPVTEGKWIKVKLRRLDTGRVVEQRSVRIGTRGRFSARIGIEKPGTYRAEAVFSHKRWRRAADQSRHTATPLPSLSVGSRSGYVTLLEKRLLRLGHHLKRRDGYFGEDTADAIMAFNKVNRRGRVRYVTADTWRALAAARRPKARYARPHFHIEVDQTRQVLFVVRGGKVRKILHVSTGAASTPTYDGTYQFWGKIAGYSPNRLYYPSYFHGARAIHGWPEVPPYNASHGCVRVPMWAAKWIYRKADIGDTIRIYH